MQMKTDARAGIMYRQWQAPSPRAALLLIHGLGAHSERWRFLAEFFLNNNISSYAIELRGFGETKEPRGHIDSLNIYIRDTLFLHQIIKNENPGMQVFLLGESMGALIAFLTAIENPHLFNGLICISPAFKNRLKFSATDYVKILASFFLEPTRQFEVPFNSTMCTKDVGYQEAMDKDPREYRQASSRLLVDIALAQLRAALLKGRVSVPLLFLLPGTEDKIIDAGASRRLFQHLKLADKELIEYPDMRHALSVELEREKVFRDIIKWAEKRIN